MNYIDLILGILLAAAAISGFRKGFIYEVVALLALIIGVWGAIHFSHLTADCISDWLNKDFKYLGIASFILTFALIVWLVHLVGKLGEKIVKAVALGPLNRLLGLVFGLIKSAFFLSVLILILSFFKIDSALISPKVQHDSYLYEPVKKIAPRVMSLFRVNYDKLLEQGKKMEKEQKQKYKWFNRSLFAYNLKEIPQDTVTCKNCDTQFKGYYCPRCGQSVSELNRPFSFVIYDFMGNLFAFDSRILRTLWSILASPGKLTQEFLNGKRARYMSPFRFYVFISFIFFLTLSLGVKNVIDINNVVNIDNAKLNEAPSLSSLIQEAKKDSITLDVDEEGEEIIMQADEILNNLKKDSVTRNNSKWAGVIAQELEENKDNWSDDNKKWARTGIKILNYPEIYISKFIQYISWSLFFLMPVFALILKLLYIRRRINYMKHLIYAINLHAFNFILFTLLLLAYIVLPKEIANYTLLILIGLPIYLFVGMKRFYNQSYRKTLLKLFILTGLYDFILLLTFSFVAYQALMNV